MRVLLTTQPAYGHFHPMLPLATALRNAGHEVRFATGARFCDVVRAAGFHCDAAGLDWLEADKSGMPQHLRPSPDCTIEDYFTQQFVTATAASFARDVVLLGGVWSPDLIVRERTEFGGAIGAAALGVPAAAVQVGSSNLFTPVQLSSIEPAYNRARAELSLGPDGDLEALETQLVFSSSPPQLHDLAIPLPSNLVSLRPSALDGAQDAQLPDWARGLGVERPLVYATLGTVFNNPAFELPFFPAVMTGLEEEAVDVVITVGPNVDPSALGPAPPNAHVHRYVPQSLLFPHCAVVVCHAGHGTLLAAIEHAVPLVAVPYGADQHLNARSVERLGIGEVIDESELTPATLRTAVRTLIDDSTSKDNIVQLRAAVNELPTIGHAVRLLENLAG